MVPLPGIEPGPAAYLALTGYKSAALPIVATGAMNTLQSQPVSKIQQDEDTEGVKGRGIRMESSE